MQALQKPPGGAAPDLQRDLIDDIGIIAAGADREKLAAWLTAIETLRADQLQLAGQASTRIARALADAAEVLTPAQRKELALRVERHRRGWHHG